MRTLRIYGKKNGEEKLIFRMLADTPSAIKTAKRNAALHGYEISRAVRIGTAETRYRDEDVTEYFINR